MIAALQVCVNIWNLWSLSEKKNTITLLDAGPFYRRLFIWFISNSCFGVLPLWMWLWVYLLTFEWSYQKQSQRNSIFEIIHVIPAYICYCSLVNHIFENNFGKRFLGKSYRFVFGQGVHSKTYLDELINFYLQKKRSYIVFRNRKPFKNKILKSSILFGKKFDGI